MVSLKTKTIVNDKSSDQKLSLSLQGLSWESFHVILVAVLIFRVPSLNYSFYYRCNVVLGLAQHVIANVLSNILEESSVSAAIVLSGTRSRVKASHEGQVLIPPKWSHSRRRCITRKLSAGNFVPMTVMQVEDQFFVHTCQCYYFRILTTLLRKFLNHKKSIFFLKFST